MLFGLNVFMMYKTQDVKNDCQVLLSSSAGAVVEHGALYTSLQVSYENSGFHQQSSNRDFYSETVLMNCAFGSGNCSRVKC